MEIRSAAHHAFGSALRALRTERRLTQQAVADECGLDRSYYGGVERGERNVSLTNMLKIMAALDATPTEVFARAETIDGTAFKPSKI